MPEANPEELIYDWNTRNRRGPLSPLRDRKLSFFDETLRDGIQSPSVRDPDIEQKMEILRLTASLGIDAVDLGLPGAGPRAVADVTALIEFAEQERLGIEYACAARTHPADINAVADIADKTGKSITVYAFLGSSPIRAYAEDWDVGLLLERTVMAADLCRERGLPMTFVTEDTTRSHPRTLDRLFRAAIEEGATRLVLCDTCGHSTPDGVRNLLGFTRSLLRALDMEERVELDWHGHNDRGHALPLSLFALEWGIDRVHGCALGIGERVGNTSMDLLLLNLHLMGELDPQRHDLSCLVEYVRKTSQYTGVPIHPSYPLSGRDAFRTATGVHAAAVIKAERKGDLELADRVYSSVPARTFGRQQEIEIGHYSGRSNVVHWLRTHGIEPADPLVDRI
ncbi:MAG: 2-isopropylmalate synthase, partial [Myxococcales bacterium]|nr:2-isopropylmalate synthase [Myxococcales bacterium]